MKKMTNQLTKKQTERGKKKFRKQYLIILLGLVAVIGVFVLFAGAQVAFADIKSTVETAEKGTSDLVQIIGNGALGICLLLFGVTQYFGVELGRWGKRLLLGAILGSAVILNYADIKSLIWNNLKA